MKLLDVYFIKQFLKPLAACLAAFLVCMVVYDLYDNIHDFIQAKAPMEMIFEYYTILIPAWLVQIMPISLLLALLYVLSDFSKHGELTAMRAAGLDCLRLMFPYFLIGTCASILMLVLNLTWAPNALQEAKVVFDKQTKRQSGPTDKATGITYYAMKHNRYWFLSVLDSFQNRAAGVEIVQTDDNYRDRQRISATSARFEKDHWIFHNVIIYDYTLAITDPGSVRRLPILDDRDFTETPAELISEFKKTKRMTTGELLETMEFSSRLSQKKRAMIASEFHSRIAFPFSNLLVFLIGIPFGVVGQRKSNFLAVVNALLFFFAYMLVAQIFFIFGQSGRFPPWIAAWLPNTIFGCTSAFMIRNVR